MLRRRDPPWKRHIRARVTRPSLFRFLRNHGGTVSIILEVTEAPVGRLRVHGARYFLPSQIQGDGAFARRRQGLNFNEVNRDIIALNQYADQRVTPSLRPGVTPGTVDIDLDVKDTFPLHGSLELNNRYSANTSELRLDGSLSYDNLWQLGHSIGGSFQLSPENPNRSRYSRVLPGAASRNELVEPELQGTKQDSAVSTIGDLAVAGRGEVIGVRSTSFYPAARSFSHTLTSGLRLQTQRTGYHVSDQRTAATPHQLLLLSVQL